MEGLGRGVDCDASHALLSSKKLPPSEAAALRRILVGGVWTQERSFRARLQATPLCPHCGQAAEDHHHLWWQCPQWNNIRQLHCPILREYASDWPPCLSRCGIMPAELVLPDPEAVLTAEGSPIPAARADGDAVSICSSSSGGDGDDVSAGSAVGPCGETIADGKVVVYTDGACRNNQLRACRVSGIGGYWCAGLPFNFGEPVREEEHTNNRAEMLAVIKVLSLELRAVDVRTDSRYVLGGVLQHRFRWRREGWRRRGKLVANADLWIKLDEILAKRPVAAAVAFTKVKAHASYKDVREGLVSANDFAGNAAADALAVSGASQGVVGSEAARQKRLRASAAMTIQRMLVDILVARGCARKSRQEELPGEQSSESEEDSASSDSSSTSTSQQTDACIWVSDEEPAADMPPD